MPPMADDPTEEMVKREMAAAIQILKDDSYLKHTKAVDERLSRLEERFGGNPDAGQGNTGKANPPPAKNDPNTSTETKKRGLWWGDALDS